jgi:N-acetylglucosamine-6-sulfatase
MPAQTVRPNIVLIAVDDLDVSSYRRLLQDGYLPNLQSVLVSRGISFENAFVTTPVCTPSRATLLTGQYAHNHRVARNEFPSGGVTVFNDTITLATSLRQAGYLTGFAGKYLNLYGNSDVNRDGSVDARDALYIPPGWDQWFAYVDPYASRMYQWVANANGSLVIAGTSSNDYQTDALAFRATGMIDSFESRDSDPFFLMVAPTAPHQEVFPDLPFSRYSDAWLWTIRPAARHAGSIALPLPNPPSFNEADMSDKPQWMQIRPSLNPADIVNLTRQYQDRLASMRAVDDLVGTLAAKLIARNEWERTVILFTSDNGFLHGEHRLPQKLVAHEESIRVPLAVAAPWLRPGTAAQVILNNDLAPTILELAGATSVIPMDGTSFASLLANPSRAPWRRRFLIERWPGRQSLFELPSYYAVRTGADGRSGSNRVMIQYADSSREFYDLSLDPNQIESIHADPSPLRVQQRYVDALYISSLALCSGAACREFEFFVGN